MPAVSERDGRAGARGDESQRGRVEAEIGSAFLFLPSCAVGTLPALPPFSSPTLVPSCLVPLGCAVLPCPLSPLCLSLLESCVCV